VINLQVSEADLRQLIKEVVRETLSQLSGDGLLGNSGRLAYLEPEAASMLGVKTSVLRDARLRGEITATRVGGRFAYEPAELQRYLAANRQ